MAPPEQSPFDSSLIVLLRWDHRLTGINQLLDKQVAAEWVPRSRLPFGNILKIARQKPDATRVAGLWAWNQLGRKVKKGEKGIRILAPIIGIRRKPDEEAEKDITTQNTRALVVSEIGRAHV